MATEDWKTISARKRATNAEKIPVEWRLSDDIIRQVSPDAELGVLDIPRSSGVLTERELELTERYDATELLKKLAADEVSAYDLTLAFCKRAAIAQQLVNCLTEIFFDKALARAKELDEYKAANGKTIGPLHGLPMSLKDSFNIKGVMSTVGFVSFMSHPPAESNSSLVDLLLQQGAIFYVKTNIPQGMMTADSENPLFSRVLNPHKLSLTAGGSTGGEGALLALRGSILGTGTDIAGSIRIPALCNGIYGFKPTSSRVPFAGITPPGREGSPSFILPSIGPEGHSIRDLELFMQTVLEADPWSFDEASLNVPWRIVSAPTRPLRFGLITEDPKRPLHPTMLRTMRAASTALTTAGHTVLPIDHLVPSLWDTATLSWQNFMLDPQQIAAKNILASGEPWVQSVIKTRNPDLEHWTASLDGLFDMNVARQQIVKAYRDIMLGNQLDAVILPPYQATAVPHDTWGVVVYTVLANCLDYPAGSIPFLKADKAADEEFVRGDVVYEPPYLPDAVEGAPSGIQIIGRPMKDEELLKIMAIVDGILHA